MPMSSRAAGCAVAGIRGNLQHLLVKLDKIATVTHQPSLLYPELPAFMREAPAVEGISARALEFLILTAVRTDEARLARWSEIDLEQRVWCIPPERMKARKEHKVPLCPQALALLRSLPSEGDFVFVSAKAGHRQQCDAYHTQGAARQNRARLPLRF